MIFREGRDYSGLISSALLVYYIFIYIHMAKIDPLTGLLNRQSYYKDIKVKEKEITAIVSIDMNNLKYLNDNFGHKAGDMALKVISAIFKEIVFYKGSVYRIGGDEFVILAWADEYDRVVELKDKIKQTLYELNIKEKAPYPLSVSIGIAKCEQDLTFLRLIERADEELYREKEMKK